MTRGTWSIALAAALAGCDEAAPGADAGATTRPSALASAEPPGPAAPLEPARDAAIVYVLAWSWDGARREGDAWVFETDLGYTVGITAAHSALSQVALVPCAEEAAGAEGDAIGEIAAWAGNMVLGTAHAAHGGTPDASTAAEPLAESWLDQTRRVFGAAEASGGAYCELHAVSAPFAGTAADGEVFAGETLKLSGFWSAPGDGERHGLEVRVNLSDGRVRPLARVAPWPQESSEGEVALVIERRPARAFDGLALEQLSDLELAYEVLGGVLQSAEVTVARRDAG